MKRFLLVLLALVLFVAPVAAGNVHFKGNKGKPLFTDNGLSLTAYGALAGLGNGDVLIALFATADVDAVCINPAGATQPPGQNPAPITVAGTQAIPADEIKNGNVAFSVTTVAPDPVIAGAPGCPNPNWTELIEDLSFTSATIQVYQPGLVLTATCTFNPPTVDGPAAATCTVS